MPRRTVKVISHGDGIRVKKAVDLALRSGRANRAHLEITAIEKVATEHEAYLRSKGATHPPNLKVLSRTNSVDHLRTLADNSIHHQWAHFMPSALDFYTRREFFKQVHRTLAPGKSFVVIESGLAGLEFARELSKAGFKVDFRRITEHEVMKMNLEDSARYVHDVQEQRQVVYRVLAEHLVKTMGYEKGMESFRREMQNPDKIKVPKQAMSEMKKAFVLMRLRNETKVTPEVRASIERMSEDLSKAMLDRKPYAKLVAYKIVKK